MRRIDLIGLIAGAIFLILLGIVFVKRTFKSAGTNCNSRLIELYVGYEVTAAEGEFDNVEWSLENAMPNGLIQNYQKMCSNGLALVSIVCPSDNRQPAVTVEGLRTTNISYFLSFNSQEHEPGRIIAGDRNLSESGTVVQLPTNVQLKWRPELGLHGSNGNLLFRDGSIRLTDDKNLSQAIDNAVNNENLISIP